MPVDARPQIAEAAVQPYSRFTNLVRLNVIAGTVHNGVGRHAAEPPNAFIKYNADRSRTSVVAVDRRAWTPRSTEGEEILFRRQENVFLPNHLPARSCACCGVSFCSVSNFRVSASISSIVCSWASKRASIKVPFVSIARTIFGRNSRQWRSAISPYCVR